MCSVLILFMTFVLVGGHFRAFTFCSRKITRNQQSLQSQKLNEITETVLKGKPEPLHISQSYSLSS